MPTALGIVITSHRTGEGMEFFSGYPQRLLMKRTTATATATPCRTLCRCLSGALGHPLTSSDLPASAAQWEKVLRLSGDHLVTPQLRWALREQDLFSTLPTDVAEYLEAVYTLNLDKNTRCEEQLAKFIQALNSLGVRPLLLKGAAVIVGGLYPTPGERMITDIDVLIPSEHLPEILDRLAAEGYRLANGNGKPENIEEPKHLSHHHYPPIYHPDWPVTIELHLHPVPLHYGRLLGADEMFREATPLKWHGGECLLPAPVHFIVHNFIHGFLHDTKYAMKNVSLRQLFEFALASRTYGNLLDWNAIRQCCKMLGYEIALRQYLTLVGVCFGSPFTPSVTADWVERVRIEPYLIRMNLQNRAVLRMVNISCLVISRLFVLVRDPGKIKRLLDKDSYLKLRDRVFPPG